MQVLFLASQANGAPLLPHLLLSALTLPHCHFSHLLKSLTLYSQSVLATHTHTGGIHYIHARGCSTKNNKFYKLCAMLFHLCALIVIVNV